MHPEIDVASSATLHAAPVLTSEWPLYCVERPFTREYRCCAAQQTLHHALITVSSRESVSAPHTRVPCRARSTSDRSVLRTQRQGRWLAELSADSRTESVWPLRFPPGAQR